MSFTPVPTKTIRLNRSELFVPGSKVDLFKNAASSNADIICLDHPASVGKVTGENQLAQKTS